MHIEVVYVVDTRARREYDFPTIFWAGYEVVQIQADRKFYGCYAVLRCLSMSFLKRLFDAKSIFHGYNNNFVSRENVILRGLKLYLKKFMFEEIALFNIYTIYIWEREDFFIYINYTC